MPTVLFADDSITIRKVAERQLTDVGLDLVFVANGEEALAWLTTGQADLVITDVIMPDRSGYEVCAYVRSEPRLARTPVLLITGIVNDEVTRQASTCGADGVIKKPFQGTSLREQVLELLAKRREPASPGVEQRDEPTKPVQPPEPAPGPVAASEGAAPQPTARVYRITEEQLQAFRQAAARIRELEAALVSEQARTAELTRRIESLESVETLARELHARLAEEGDRSARLASQVQALESALAEERARSAAAGPPTVGDAEAEPALAREQQEAASLRERLGEAERAVERMRMRQQELIGRLAEIARLAVLSEDEASLPLADELGRDDSRL